MEEKESFYILLNSAQLDIVQRESEHTRFFAHFFKFSRVATKLFAEAKIRFT